ncbi:MAG: T9SS type A sorting domain-containing protein, partial [Ignavibacteriaceae bacterium]|nr:T9SS type A sorting domain-containing protein [Ignavibacteriaceae bacterium]
GGGNDNEAGMEDNHIIELEQLLVYAQVENVFGQMGLHTLINKEYIPVELTSFTASLNNNNVTLNWNTATELNNKGFEIERTVTSLTQSWLSIGFVPGFGTTTEPHTYSFIDSDLESGKYLYRLKQIDFDGSFEYSDEVEVEISLPLEYELAQNYPNPFNPSTAIKYTVPSAGTVQLKVYDILGNEVTTLVNEYEPAGIYNVEWNASSFQSGVYFYQLKTEGIVETKKMVLLK